MERVWSLGKAHYGTAKRDGEFLVIRNGSCETNLTDFTCSERAFVLLKTGAKSWYSGGMEGRSGWSASCGSASDGPGGIAERRQDE